jgi:hypothetical protein
LSADAYSVRARQHAPRTIEEARAAAQRLLGEGYNDYGIAAALGLAVDQVRRMLGPQIICA